MDTAYPCGGVEEFVLSSNRRKLLQIGNHTKDGEEYQEIEQASIVHGSEKHLYFHSLQIENEITSILVNNKDLDKISDSDSFAIKSLLNEAHDIISKHEDSRKQEEY